MSTFPADKQLPNTDPIIRQTDCQYSFNKEAITLTLKFLGDVGQAVGLAASYRTGTRITVSDLTSKFTELNGVLPITLLEATGRVSASTSVTKQGSGQANITVQVPYKAKIDIGGSGDDDPEKRIIVTWAEKSTNNEYDLGVYCGDGESASTRNAGDFEAWKNEKNKNIERYKNFQYTGEDGEAVDLGAETKKVAEKWYKGIESVMRAYPEVIRTTQYFNYKADEDEVDNTLISQIQETPKLYYRDQTPATIWQSKFDNFDWLKASYDVQTEATEYQKLWNITVTESWIGCDIDEQGTWDDDLYGPDGTRWHFAMKGQGAQPSGNYDDGTPIQPSDVNGKGRLKNDTFQNQSDIKNLDTGGDFYAVDDNSFSATPTRGLRSTPGVPALETIKMPEINFIGDDAFNGAANLQSINIKEQVTYMGERVCKDCTSLTEAIVKPSIYTLPESTFEGCTALDAPSGAPLTLGGLINAVGANAFKDCTSLTSIACENAITSIGANAFDGDTELKSFSMATDSTGSITLGDEAFKGCEKLADIELPIPTITLGTDTFDGAFDDEVTVKAPKSFLTNLPNTSSYNYIYPAFVTTIAQDEWRDDTKLLSAVVCDAITSIPENAFRGCTNCTSVTLPDTVTSLKHDAFRQSGITSFTVPPLITGTLAYNLFYQCTALESVDFNNVTLLGADIFSGCTSLTELINEDKLTSIQARAFSDCAFVEFNGGSGLAGLGQSCFRRNAALKSFKIPENETGSLTIGATAFDSCTALERIEIPVGGTMTIGTTIFNNGLASEIWLKAPFNADLIASVPSSKAINFIYPSFTTSIAANEWQNNTKLVGVTIPDSVTSIGDNAFNGTRISSITIGENVTSIGNAAFRSNTAMTEATLNPGSTGVGAHTFNGNTALQTINIGGTTLTTIPNNFAKNCSALTTVNVTAPLTTINNGSDANNGAFINCTALTTIDFLPNTLTTIGDYAFKLCTSVNSVTIPSSVTTIGAQVFAGCSALLSLTIPSSVTSIGNIAFNNLGTSSNLPEVTMEGKTVSTVQGMTNYPWGLRTGTTVHCSDGDITIS